MQGSFRVTMIAGWIVLAAARLIGQAAPAISLAFDTTSVKPARPNDPNSNFNVNDGQVTTENLSVNYLLRLAFGLSTGANDLIVDEPAWARSSTFDIKTTLDEGTRSQLAAMNPDMKEQAVHLMVRRLLEEGFGLKAHLETQPRTVLALVSAKHAPSLRPAITCDTSKETCSHGWRGLHNNNGHIEGRSATLAMLANVLSTQPDVGGRTVVDQTKLAGPYDFDLQYTPDTSAVASGPSLFAALQDQLGLKLVSVKLPVQVLVLDQISQPAPD